MEFTYVRLWWLGLWLRIAAWFALRGRDRDLKAAEALFRLNRVAKSGWGSGSTYEMKTLVLKHFYEQGWCVQAVKSVQELECWHTTGYLNGWTKICPKCGNTGVFARHELFAFTFVIRGTVFRWHQPDRLVNWPVKISSEPVIYTPREAGEVAGYTEEDKKRDEMLLWVYLRLAGVKELPALIALRKAVQTDWEILRSDVKFIVRKKIRTGGWKLPRGLAVRLLEWADDRIPF